MNNSKKYLVRNFRFSTNGNKNQPWKDYFVKELSQISKLDYGCFRIINRFFDAHRKNYEAKSVISERLESLKEEQEIIDIVSVNNYIFLKLKALLLKLFENSSINEMKYRLIYSGFLEYITMMWKKVPGQHGNVYFEPTIKYKRKKMYSGYHFENSKCDIVYRNSRLKEFTLLECKFGLRTFFNLLSACPDGKKKQLANSIRRAHNKIEYLRAFSIDITNDNSDILNLEVAIVTFATRSSINSMIHLLQGITVIPREEIESNEIYSQIAK